MTRNLARLSLVLFLALPAGAGAEVADLPPLPERNPLRAAPRSALPGDRATIPWTEAEIGAATAKCHELLTGDPLDYELLPPLKEGLCGTPVPVLLRAVGHDPKVTINPPATLSCPMADRLGEWLQETVQPEAKALFGSPVVKISNSSSYVCRNRYGGANTILSEHALANAFDASEFVLANGERISVLDHWPRVATTPSPSEPKPVRVGTSASSKQESVDRAPSPMRVGASPSSNPFVKAESDSHRPDAVTTATAESEASPSPSTVAEEPAPATDPAPGTSASSNPFVKAESDSHGPDAVTPAKADSEAPPSPAPAAAEPPGPDAKSKFVTFLHEDACRRFGTVLGPNANEAHKDHFHLDMKKRRRASYCE